jgi:hypothetical protein
MRVKSLFKKGILKTQDILLDGAVEENREGLTERRGSGSRKPGSDDLEFLPGLWSGCLLTHV